MENETVLSIKKSGDNFLLEIKPGLSVLHLSYISNILQSVLNERIQQHKKDVAVIDKNVKTVNLYRG